MPPPGGVTRPLITGLISGTRTIAESRATARRRPARSRARVHRVKTATSNPERSSDRSPGTVGAADHDPDIRPARPLRAPTLARRSSDSWVSPSAEALDLVPIRVDRGVRLGIADGQLFPASLIDEVGALSEAALTSDDGPVCAIFRKGGFDPGAVQPLGITIDRIQVGTRLHVEW